MHTKNDILANTLEGMLADAEDNGREGIQPMLTPDDVKIILHALKLAEPVSVCAEPVSPFANTIECMLSTDYKKRFKAEYAQTKIRYERLKAFNTKIEAANRTNEWLCRYEMPKVEMPKHDCPDDILEQQQHLMGQYLHILELRAVIEGIEL